MRSIHLLATLALLSTSLASAEELKPEIKDPSKSRPLAHTSSKEVLTANPIRLKVSKNDLSSDLPGLDKPIGVNEAVEVGLKNNLDFLAAKESWLSSKYLARAALAKFGPRASFDMFYANSSLDQMLFFMNWGEVASAPMQPIVRGNSFYTLFAGYQPLFTGGRLLGNYKGARAAERQSLAVYLANRIKAALKVKEAYWKAAWELAKLQVGEDYARYRQWSVKLMQARLKEGKVPKADVLREETELSKARQIVNNGYRDYNEALLELKVALGVSIGATVDLRDTLEYAEIAHGYEHYLGEARVNRPAIMQADEQVKQMRAKYMQARSKYLPQVGLYGLVSNASGHIPGIERSVEGRWGGTVGIISGVTLFDSGERLNELRAARAAVRQAEIERKNVHLNVAKEVSTAWIDLDLARRNVALAEAEVTSAKEDERLYYRRYLVGKAIELDYFVSGVRYFEARLSLVKAIYEYRLAEASLVWASGAV